MSNVKAVKFNALAKPFATASESYSNANAAVEANLANLAALLKQHANRAGGHKTWDMVGSLAHVNLELCDLIAFLGGSK